MYLALMVSIGLVVARIVYACYRPTHKRFWRSDEYKADEKIYAAGRSLMEEMPHAIWIGGVPTYLKDYKLGYKKYAEPIRNRAQKRAVGVGMVFALALGFAAANTISYTWTAHHGQTREATIGEVVQHFGLKSGKVYPLALGGLIKGTSGDIDVSSGLFYTSVDAKFTPSQSVKIGFNDGNKSYILELPNRISYTISETSEPSVRLWISHAGDDFYYFNSASGKGVNGVDTLVEYDYTPCKQVWRNLVLQCEHDVVGKTVTVGGTLESRGLIPIVQEYFDRAEITLTQEQYSQLLNG